MSINIEAMRFCTRSRRIEWQRHALERMVKRVIMRDEVIDILLNGECIEEYPEDFPFPSALFSGKLGNRYLHVVASCDVSAKKVYIITAYEPNVIHFDPDFRTRRIKK